MSGSFRTAGHASSVPSTLLALNRLLAGKQQQWANIKTMWWSAALSIKNFAMLKFLILRILV